jgi:hypothetical protein
MMSVVQKLSSLSIGLILMQSSVVVAQSLNFYPSYVPKNDTDNSSPQRRTASSSRGCSGEEIAQLTIIAPQDEIALTTLDRPTFFIYLSKIPSHHVKMSITHPKESEPYFETDLKVEKAGWQRIEVPASRQSLKAGETYILTAGILCNPLRLSDSIYARITFKKVNLSAQAKQKLALAANDLEKAGIYATEGIWYDAIKYAYQDRNYFNFLISQSKIHVSSAP